MLIRASRYARRNQARVEAELEANRVQSGHQSALKMRKSGWSAGRRRRKAAEASTKEESDI